MFKYMKDKDGAEYYYIFRYMITIKYAQFKNKNVVQIYHLQFRKNGCIINLSKTKEDTQMSKLNNYSEEGIINLFEAVMEQAREDANYYPTVTFKPNNDTHNNKQIKKLLKAAQLRTEAQDYIKGLQAVYTN